MLWQMVDRTDWDDVPLQPVSRDYLVRSYSNYLFIYLSNFIEQIIYFRLRGLYLIFSTSLSLSLSLSLTLNGKIK